MHATGAVFNFGSFQASPSTAQRAVHTNNADAPAASQSASNCSTPAAAPAPAPAEHEWKPLACAETYDLEYVEDVSAEFMCGICLEVFHEPRFLNNCGHVFCAACLEQLRRSDCPNCNAPIQSMAPAHTLRSLIGRLQVFPHSAFAGSAICATGVD